MKNLRRSFLYAFNGIAFVFQGRNFRIQLVIALLVLMAGFYVELTRSEWALIIVTIGFVLSFETMNTAVENLVNLVTPEYNSLAGKIKDLSAAAVLIASIIAAIIGLIIFSSYL